MVTTSMALACAALALATAATAAEVATQQSAAMPSLSFVEGSVHRLVDAMDSITQQPGGIIGQYIVGTLQPQARETVGHMQTEIDNAVTEVKACGGMLWNVEKETEHKEDILNSDEGEKYTCLAEEHKLHKEEKTQCGAYDHELRKAANTYGDLPPVAERTVESMSSFFEKTDDFSDDYDSIKDKKDKCEKATEACELQHNTCVVDEETIAKFYCSMKYQRDQACRAYDQCYQDAGRKLEAVEAKMKELEKHVKDHYTKMACFQDGVGNLEQDPSACNHQLFDTVHLDVSYPGVPPEEQCVTLMKMRRDYSSITCSGAEVVWHPPTPAPLPVASSSPANASSSPEQVTSPVAPPNATSQ